MSITYSLRAILTLRSYCFNKGNNFFLQDYLLHFMAYISEVLPLRLAVR